MQYARRKGVVRDGNTAIVPSLAGFGQREELTTENCEYEDRERRDVPER